jgi:hypothetical protein
LPAPATTSIPKLKCSKPSRARHSSFLTL